MQTLCVSLVELVTSPEATAEFDAPGGASALRCRGWACADKSDVFMFPQYRGNIIFSQGTLYSLILLIAGLRDPWAIFPHQKQLSSSWTGLS